jgi:hypothetical protein
MVRSTPMNSALVLSSLNEGTPEAAGFAVGGMCIPNISPLEQRRRLMGGVIQFAFGLAVLTALIMRGLNRWWRLPLFLSFWGAAAGFFQWRDKT